jgi:hypothetical protein
MSWTCEGEGRGAGTLESEGRRAEMMQEKQHDGDIMEVLRVGLIAEARLDVDWDVTVLVLAHSAMSGFQGNRGRGEAGRCVLLLPKTRDPYLCERERNVGHSSCPAHGEAEHHDGASAGYIVRCSLGFRRSQVKYRLARARAVRCATEFSMSERTPQRPRFATVYPCFAVVSSMV